jgi:AraC-like DNA-binding protein
MIKSYHTRIIHREVRNRGISDRLLFEGTSLTADDLWHTATLPTEQFLQILRNVRALLGEEVFLNHVYSGPNIAALGHVGLAMMSSPTLGAGLSALVSYFQLEASYWNLDMRTYGGVTRLSIDFDTDVGELTALHVIAAQIGISNYISDVVGADHSSITYCVREKIADSISVAPDPIKNHMRLTPYYAVELPTGLMDALSPFFDEQNWNSSMLDLGRRMQMASEQHSKVFTDHVMHRLCFKSPAGITVKDCASYLHMSVRTLNRRLESEGTSFTELKVRAVDDIAKRLLLLGTSVDAVAYELGYENPSNFRRRFKDTNNLSPRNWVDTQLRINEQVR